jgi:hypothetical protein
MMSATVKTQHPMNTIVRKLLMCLCGIGLSTVAYSQTVRPVIAELGNPAKGRIEYYNDSLTPLNVVLEAKSFTVSDTGELTYRPLDSTIHLKLSTTSFRLEPQQSYYVFYEAQADAPPGWFVIYAGFSGFPFRTDQGMNIRLELPHTVYLLPKGSLGKSDVQVDKLEFKPAEKKLYVEVENTGDRFGRVQETIVNFGKKKQEAPGFPIFPHRKRIMEVALDQSEPPSSVVLQFKDFKIEEKLQTSSP